MLILRADGSGGVSGGTSIPRYHCSSLLIDTLLTLVLVGISPFLYTIFSCICVICITCVFIFLYELHFMAILCYSQ